jgi:general stress protein CsbA
MEHRRQTTAGIHPTDLDDGVATAHHGHSRLALLSFFLLCAVALLGLSASLWVVMVDGASLLMPIVLVTFFAAAVASTTGTRQAPAER